MFPFPIHVSGVNCVWAALCSSLLCLHNPSHSYSKEDPHDCAVWLIMDQDAAPQIYVGLLTQCILFSKPTHWGLLWHMYSFTRQLSSSLLYSVCLAWWTQLLCWQVITVGCCWLLGGKKGRGGVAGSWYIPFLSHSWSSWFWMLLTDVLERRSQWGLLVSLGTKIFFTHLLDYLSAVWDSESMGSYFSFQLRFCGVQPW